MAVYDVLRGANPQAGALLASLDQAIRDQRLAAVVLGKRTRPKQILTPAYAPATTVATP